MKQKILFVLCLLMGLMMVNAGLNMYFHFMPMPENMPEKAMNMFNGLMQVGWILPMVGAAMIVGGVLFAIPKFRAVGALILFPVVLGILCAHLFSVPDGLPIALVLVAILGWAMFENREKYLGLL